MRQWMPISTSPRGRLALAAVAAFGARPFAEVAVADLAADAGVTTGALYHHFGSKAGLYAFVRRDVERRVLDRVEGALAAGATVVDALAVALDFAAAERLPHLLDAPATDEPDALAAVLGAHVGSVTLGAILAAAWRAGVRAVGDGTPVQEVREALAAITIAQPHP